MVATKKNAKQNEVQKKKKEKSSRATLDYGRKKILAV